MKPIRVLIADDHPLFRAGLRAMLDSLDDMQVAGEAGSGEETVELARTLEPDVILMDIQMPGMSGLEATRKIVESCPASRVLVLTMFADDEVFFPVLRAGARGYLLKGSRPDEVLRAIRAVANDEVIFGAQVAGRALQSIQGGEAAPPGAALPALTARELEILDLLARNLSNKEIAARLVLSPKTVRNQVSILFSRLKVSGRAEAIRTARQAGLGQ